MSTLICHTFSHYFLRILYILVHSKRLSYFVSFFYFHFDVASMHTFQEYLHFSYHHFFRYPVRDDSIVSIDVKGKHPLPLPEAQSTLALPQELMNDMICIWDFLNNFR